MKTSRRDFIKTMTLLGGVAGLGQLPSLVGGVEVLERPRKRKVYWWVGGGTRIIDTLAESEVDGICAAGIPGYDLKWEKKKVYPLVFDHGSSSNDMVNTLVNLKALYKEGWRQISTDLEKRDYSEEDTKLFIETVQSLPGLKVIQWNGYWNWKKPQWEMLEKCEKMVLAEMVYPLVSDENRNYDQVSAWIRKEMSHYSFIPEERHAIALSTVCHGTHMDLPEPLPPLAWEKMKMQIDAAIDYGNYLGHSRQALGFYYPTPPEYAKKIMDYIREKDKE